MEQIPAAGAESGKTRNQEPMNRTAQSTDQADEQNCAVYRPGIFPTLQNRAGTAVGPPWPPTTGGLEGMISNIANLSKLVRLLGPCFA